jgi:type IV secretory pathway ATPase VirB11/archaellum biosynthesis ATPase
VIKDSENLDLGKLSSFLSDLSVTGIECPGPNKNVLVNKSGLVQTTSVTMSADEMQAILKDFSEKTKIPLIPGIFKALYNNLLITAVISEIAGNRFIIEKHFGQLNLPKKEQ